MVIPNAYRHHWVAMATSARTVSTDIHWPPQTHQALKKKNDRNPHAQFKQII